MKIIITEVVIPLGDGNNINACQKVTIRLYNDGDGEYIGIEGDNIDRENSERLHEFFLNPDEIDKFANVCKSLVEER